MLFDAFHRWMEESRESPRSLTLLRGSDGIRLAPSVPRRSASLVAGSEKRRAMIVTAALHSSHLVWTEVRVGECVVRRLP